MQKQLESVFGEKVKVEFIDTRKSGLNSHPQIAQVASMGYGFPIIAVNGQPRFAGGIDVSAIQALLSKDME